MFSINIDLIRGVKGFIKVSKRLKKSGFSKRSRAIIHKAVQLEEAELYTEALKLYQQLIILNPQMAKPYTLAAIICFKLGDFEQVETLLRKSKRWGKSQTEWFNIYTLEYQLKFNAFEKTYSITDFKCCLDILEDLRDEFPGFALTFANSALLHLEAIAKMDCFTEQEKINLNKKAKKDFRHFLEIASEEPELNINFLDKAIRELRSYEASIQEDAVWQKLRMKGENEIDLYMIEKEKKKSSLASKLVRSFLSFLTLGGIILLDCIDAL